MKMLSPAQIPTRTLVCKHCRHQWVTRKPAEDNPLICPACRTWRWNTDAQYVSAHELDRIARFVRTGKHAKKRA